ncbi:RNA helicase [Gracilaria domingensis]|nr:RNA helicase [Gracilaria domingensis]
MPEIINAVEDLGWHLPTPVQMEAIPLILGGGDVAVAAATGSGKTGAFCLPIAQIVYETRNTNLSKQTTPFSPDEEKGPIRLSAVDRGRQVAVSDDRTVAQSRHHAIWEGVRATKGVCQGKWYYVAKMRDDGICRVGWSSRHAQLNLGTDLRGFGYGGTAMKSHGAKFDPYGEKYGKGDVICCMIEFVQHSNVNQSKVSISFMKNDKELGTAFSVPWSHLGMENITLYPAVAFRNGEVETDFQEASRKAEQMGFKPIREAREEDCSLSEDMKTIFAVRSDAEDIDMTDIDKTEVKGEKGKAPLTLILEPSRELAGQVDEELKKFKKYLPQSSLRQLLLIGGGKPKAERAAIKSGLDIVAGTLGTVVHHVKSGALNLDAIRFFVLDEADTFAEDNLRDILFLYEKIPSRNRVQTLLFSATLHSPEIKGLSEKIQTFPTWVDLKGKESVPEAVHHTMVRLDADADTSMLDTVPERVQWPLDQVHIDIGEGSKVRKKQRQQATDIDMVDAADVRSQVMKKLKLAALRQVIDAHDMTQAMIFVRTQQDGDNVESFLIQCSGIPHHEVNKYRFQGRRDSGPEVEYSCAVLHGGKRQHERNEALNAFKAGEVRFLICTDVAARGIDIVGLPYLVNVSLPDKAENYIHRVGRVGRAERLGLAVSLVSSQKEAVWFHTCNKSKMGICKNRKLVSVGGCIVWQNEAKMLAEIEERLKGRIEELGSNFKRKNENAGPILYGSRIGEEQVNQQTAKYVAELQPSVEELVRLEEQAQALFLSLQMQPSQRVYDMSYRRAHQSHWSTTPAATQQQRNNIINTENEQL